MFTWLNKQAVQSDKGFIVRFTGRFTAEYQDQDKVMEVEVDDGLNGGVPCIIINTDAFARWNGESTPIPAVHRMEIFQNFKDAMAFQRLDTVVSGHKTLRY